MSANIQNRLKRNESIILRHIREPIDEEDRTVTQSVRKAITEIDNEIRRLGHLED